MQTEEAEGVRLLPITASEFYKLRGRLSAVADQVLAVSNGGPFSVVETEQWWLDLIYVAVRLDNAWNARRPHLMVVK